MSKELLFWILMLIWAVFGVWGYRDPAQPWARGGWVVMTFILFLLLGWAVFGAPLK